MWKRRISGTAFDVRTLNPFRFSSEYADDALGLVYYNYRHYEPVTGRWMSRDFVLSVNLYSMVNNSIAIDMLGLECAGKVCIYSAVGRYENYSKYVDVPMVFDNGIPRHTWLVIESCDTDEHSWVQDPDNTYSFGPNKEIKNKILFFVGVPSGFLDPVIYAKDYRVRIVKKCWTADKDQVCCVKNKLGKYPPLFSYKNYCTTETLRLVRECGFANVPDGVGDVVNSNGEMQGRFPNPFHLALQLENEGGIDLNWTQRLRDIGVKP